MVALGGSPPGARDETGTVVEVINLLPLALAFALLFLVLNRGRRQQQSIAKVQASLAAGREVMTASGMYARVVSVEGDVVVLEAAPGQNSRWARQAIVRVLDDAAPEEPSTDPKG